MFDYFIHFPFMIRRQCIRLQTGSRKGRMYVSMGDESCLNWLKFGHKIIIQSGAENSHELNYISATNCFMPLGQSSGN